MKFVITLGDVVELALVAFVAAGVGICLVVEWVRGVKRKKGGR